MDRIGRKDDINKIINRQIGKKLKWIMISYDLNLANIAEMMGVSIQQTQKYIKGTNRLSVNRLHLLAEKLKFDPRVFFEDINYDFFQKGERSMLLPLEMNLNLSQERIIQKFLRLKKKENINLMKYFVTILANIEDKESKHGNTSNPI